MRRTLPGALLLAVVAMGLAGCASSRVDHGAPAQLSFGVQMARRGLWNEAIFRFEQARRQDPGNPRVLNNLAVANEALGRFDKAQQLYQEALRLAPGEPELKRNYARFIEFYQAFTTGQKPAPEPGTAAAPPSAPPSPQGGSSR